MNTDPKPSKPDQPADISISERMALGWTWATGISMFAVSFGLCCWQDWELTLVSSFIVWIAAFVFYRCGQTKFAFFGCFIICAILVLIPYPPRTMASVMFATFLSCVLAGGILLSVLGKRRHRWAGPVVVSSVALAYFVCLSYSTMQKQRIESLLEQYPKEMLYKRLGKRGVSAPIERRQWAPEIDDEITFPIQDNDLDFIDYQWNKLADHLHPNRRQNKLRNLHNETVRQFTMMPDNGVARMPRMSVEPIKALTIETIKYQSPDKFWPDTIVRNYIETNPAEISQQEPTARRVWQDFSLPYTPDENEYLYHFAASQDFLDPLFFGYTFEGGGTAGFVEHAFHHSPPGIEIDDRKWKLTQLQLVSIDRFEQPKVYVLDHLPRMDQLTGDKVETRSLNEFETSALDQLKTGEQIVVKTGDNLVSMFGALRSRASCIKCHASKKGELIGAFSYQFVPMFPK